MREKYDVETMLSQMDVEFDRRRNEELGNKAGTLVVNASVAIQRPAAKLTWEEANAGTPIDAIGKALANAAGDAVTQVLAMVHESQRDVAEEEMVLYFKRAISSGRAQIAEAERLNEAGEPLPEGIIPAKAVPVN